MIYNDRKIITKKKKRMFFYTHTTKYKDDYIM